MADTTPMTIRSHQKLQEELQQLKTTERVRIAKALEEARAHGDLSENAEYKAALEKQSILNETTAKLREELERVEIFIVSDAPADRIAFGTKVVLVNGKTGAEEAYTILGPWESDAENNIISYLSPFGAALINKRAGESFDFSRNDETVVFTVKEIKNAFAQDGQ